MPVRVPIACSDPPSAWGKSLFFLWRLCIINIVKVAWKVAAWGTATEKGRKERRQTLEQVLKPEEHITHTGGSGKMLLRKQALERLT